MFLTLASRDFIVQMTKALDGASIPVRPHHTGSGKSSLRYGVDALAVELDRGQWTLRGLGDPHVEALIRAMIAYLPTEHVDDSLAALVLARAAAEHVFERVGFVPSLNLLRR